MTKSSLAELPRSVRWRIQLGSLIEPQTVDDDSLSATPLETVFKFNERIIQEQNARFQEFVRKYVEVEVEERDEEGQESEENNQNSAAAEIDPLTAMVMEQEARESKKAELMLKYRKEKARRKRGLAPSEVNKNVGDTDEHDGIDRASLGIIEKDLNRLPHPTESGLGPNGNNKSPKQEARMASLREILYIYAQVHPNMGYRQGMHEIASYLLFLLELEQEQFPENHPLFSPILPICFDLLERILGQLQTAYDVQGEQSLNKMSQAILTKIHQNDSSLFQLLTTNPNIPPPPIYCTRWVRLLFSREVTGYENVFKLWDVLFEYKLMRVLEVTSSSRILLLRNALMNPENNTLDLLMNVPPLSDISPLTNVLRRLMNQKNVSDVPISIPSEQLFDKAVPVSNQIPPMPVPGPLSFQSQGQLQSHGSADSGKFSFAQMGQALGQKGESWRKKIIATTNEWKQQAAANQRDMEGFTPTQQNIYTPNKTISESRLFSDHFTNPLTIGSTPEPTMSSRPKSPRQHQHEMWAKLLKTKIWTVQDYLMKIESKETGQKVPGEIWEALVDLDRIQRELHNYANSLGDN